MSRGDKQVHLETLLVSEVIEFARPAGGELLLRDFRGHEPFEQRAGEWRPRERLFRLDPEQVAGQPRVPK